MVLRKSVSAMVVVVLGIASQGLADLPTNFDLRDVNGQQYVSTRIDDQVGPGPCWAFATMTAVESSVRLQGLWPDNPNGLNLSEQFLRANETTGTTWPEGSPGFNRRVNSGGNDSIGISHMARLHGPLYESQCPFEYLGDYTDSSGYYDGTITTSSGNEHSDPATANWPYARPYPAEYTSDAEGAYFLRKAYQVGGSDAIKQKIMNVGAGYVRITHKFGAFDKETNTYYDDGSWSTGDPGLGAHAMNIIGWDDSKQTAADNPGAWLVKQSHEVDGGDPMYPDHAGEAPTYFWVSYETYADGGRWMEGGKVSFFEMRAKGPIHSVYFHDYTGNHNSTTGYHPDGSDKSVCAQVFQTGDTGDEIGVFSFFTGNPDQPYELKLFDSLADLEAGEGPLAELTGVAELPGYHTVELDQPVVLDPDDDFVVFLDFTDGADQIMAYSRDGTGQTGTIEMIENDWCYYYDEDTGQWLDLADHWDGEAWTVKAYGVPEPAMLSLLAVAAVGLLRRRHR